MLTMGMSAPRRGVEARVANSRAQRNGPVRFTSITCWPSCFMLKLEIAPVSRSFLMSSPSRMIPALLTKPFTVHVLIRHLE